MYVRRTMMNLHIISEKWHHFSVSYIYIYSHFAVQKLSKSRKSHFVLWVDRYFALSHIQCCFIITDQMIEMWNVDWKVINISCVYTSYLIIECNLSEWYCLGCYRKTNDDFGHDYNKVVIVSYGCSSFIVSNKLYAKQTIYYIEDFEI